MKEYSGVPLGHRPIHIVHGEDAAPNAKAHAAELLIEYPEWTLI
jgi:hypothetical protein